MYMTCIQLYLANLQYEDPTIVKHLHISSIPLRHHSGRSPWAQIWMVRKRLLVDKTDRTSIWLCFVSLRSKLPHFELYIHGFVHRLHHCLDGMGDVEASTGKPGCWGYRKYGHISPCHESLYQTTHGLLRPRQRGDSRQLDPRDCMWKIIWGLDRVWPEHERISILMLK